MVVTMNQGKVVLLGNLSTGRLAFGSLAAEFGWTVQEAGSLGDLAEFSAGHKVDVVLFSPRHLDLPWEHALRSVLAAAPRALPILCHTFGESTDWQRTTRVGFFHSLPLPFDAREVRQSLGFAWAAKRRSAAVRIPRRSRPSRVMREQPARVLAHPSAIVA